MKMKQALRYFFGWKAILAHGLSCGTSEICEFFVLFNLAYSCSAYLIGGKKPGKSD